MSQKSHQRRSHEKKHPQPDSHRARQKSKQKWMTRVVVLLMLAAMLMYVLSDDESMPPQDLEAPSDSMKAPQRAVPAD